MLPVQRLLVRLRTNLNSSRRLDVAGLTVLVTGGSRGLGLELARELGGRGAKVAICARDLLENERAVADLRARGITATGIAGDLCDRADVRRIVEQTEKEFGPIDVLVNNAGTISVGPAQEMSATDYQQAMDTHFWAPFWAIEVVLPGMRDRGAGRIVNIASIGGRVSVPHLLPYSASKFALVGYSEGLRAALIRDRIYVTTVVPGLMRTGSPENAGFKGQHRKEYAWFSIADSLPFLSVDVITAAQRIVDALERGDADVTISAPAKLASIAHGIFPGLVVEALGIVNRFLPGAGGVGSQTVRGRDSHSPLAPSWLTGSTQHRAMTQNEVGS